MEQLDLPPRMFAQGHEPVGIRVQAYHPSRGISRIISALDEDEVEYIRQSSFGKLLTVPDKPTFSGRFVRFLLSRMLKVNKKHEVWFLFCARPIRFSLREFAIVTGLPCSEFPKKSKRKLSNMISEKSNWGALFGTLKSISVKMVIKMLRKKKVTDRTIRLKYACLAILDSVILPTTHKHKISKEHAEAIKDLDEFLAYPWGRVAFEMLLSSITDRDEVSLSQPTLALKGFVHAIQLVLVEAVPLLNEGVQPKTHSDSESGEDSDDSELKEAQHPKVTLNPSHARIVHEEEQTASSRTLINEIPLDETMFIWSDETVDPRVDTMVNLVAEEHEFCSSMFGGGMTVADVDRMRKEVKLKKDRQLAAKNKVPTAHSTTGESSTCMDDFRIPAEDIQRIADCLSLRVSTQVDEKIELMRQNMLLFKSEIIQSVTDFQSELINLINSKLPGHSQCIASENINAGDDIRNVSANEGTVMFEHPVASPQHTMTSAGAVEAASADLTSNPELPAHNETRTRLPDIPGIQCDAASCPSAEHDENSILPPQFSLGLTQQFADPATKKGPECGPLAAAHDAASCPSAEHDESPILPPKFSLGLTQQFADPATKNGPECGPLAAAHDITKPPSIQFPSFSLGLTQQMVEPPTETEKASFPPHVFVDVEEPHASVIRPQNSLGLSEPGDSNGSKDSVESSADLPSNVDSQTFKVTYGTTLQYLWTSKESESLTLKFSALVKKLLPQYEFGVGEFCIKSRELREVYDSNTAMSANVMNVLLHHTCSLLSNCISSSFRVDFLDTKFVMSFLRGYSKFARLRYKEKHTFPKSILTRLRGDIAVSTLTDRFYIPLLVKKLSWKGLCVDFGLSTIYVLDPNTEEMDFAVLKKEVQPFAAMFPYALQQVFSGEATIPLEEFAIEVVTGIHQFEMQFNSGIATVLLMQAHSVGGPEECRRLTPEVLQLQARKFLVTLYEEHRAPLPFPLAV